MMRIELYGRAGCHLCEEAAALLQDARRRHEFELVELDVDDDPAWRAAYGDDVPVVVIDGRRAFKHRIPRRELERYFVRS
jgi:glutaredoxin